VVPWSIAATKRVMGREAGLSNGRPSSTQRAPASSHGGA
jgi:hypothetical protein